MSPRITLVAFSMTAIFACTAVPASDDNDLPGLNDAPILDEIHLGWKAQNCESCHDLPVANHTQTASASCANCHGGNGACSADSPLIARTHSKTDDCVSCHEKQHGFVATSECTNCHYADVGRVECTRDPIVPSGGGLSTLLTPGCYNLSNSNTQRTETKTALQVGEAAVDFTLKDRNGAEVSLAGLLATKPVALVFGAYT